MHRIRNVALFVAALAFLAACQQAPTAVDGLSGLDGAEPAAAKGGQKDNQKFTFTDVTLSEEGVVVAENGVIEAASRDKKNDKQDWTECTYFTEDYAESLGTFGSSDFASTDAGEVLDFCLQHFPDRQ